MKSLALSATLLSCLSAKEYTVKSPDGKVSASFELKKGALFYTVSRDGIAVVVSSKVEIFEGAKIKVRDHSVRENDSSWEPVWGRFSTIRDHHRELFCSGGEVSSFCAYQAGVGVWALQRP